MNNTIIIIVILLLILLIISSRTEHFEQSEEIPKIIWTFWHTNKNKASKFIKFCYFSMKKMCPNYTIYHLDFSNYKNYVTDTTIINIIDSPIIPINYKSDLIRTYLMYTYGGVYLDASILLLKPLDEIIGSNQSKIIMYKNWYHSNNTQRPILESWFIASPPHKLFNKLVLKEFTKFLNLGQFDQHIYFNKLLIESNVDYQYFKPYHGYYHAIYFIYTYIHFKYATNFDLYFLDFKHTPHTMSESYIPELYIPINDHHFNNLMKANLIKFTYGSRQLIEGKSITPHSFMYRYIEHINKL